MKHRRFSALLVNLRCFISLPDFFLLAPTNRPWVSEDATTAHLLCFFFSLQATPPLCQVHNMPTPTLLFVGKNDVLGDPADVEALKPQISNLLHYEEIPGWNHLDFLYGLDASKLLYAKIVSIMKGIE